MPFSSDGRQSEVDSLHHWGASRSRHVKREKASLPVDVRRSKTPLLKLPVV